MADMDEAALQALLMISEGFDSHGATGQRLDP